MPGSRRSVAEKVVSHGFVRVASAVGRTRVADCVHNAERIADLMARAGRESVSVLAFPELAVTGYTDADLFQQAPLLTGALDALERLIDASTRVFDGICCVGLPVSVDGRLFNCAAVLCGGQLAGLVPKSYLPNYKEFYEARWFSRGEGLPTRMVRLFGRDVPFGPGLLFEAVDLGGLVLGVEICEDLWVPVPPSSLQALAGATVLVNLSASNDLIGKAAYRRQLVVGQSGRCVAAYVYASSGPGESTTDVVFGGHCLIAENGACLADSERFDLQEKLVCADVDLERILLDRMRLNTFGECARGLADLRSFVRIGVGAPGRPAPARLSRPVEPRPFVPRDRSRLSERCREIFQIQVAGLSGRLEHLGTPPVTIGVSGGLDSTLALLVVCKTMDRLGRERQAIDGVTMPGFGTSLRTLTNGRDLMGHLGTRSTQIDIRSLCLAQMQAIGHRPFGLEIGEIELARFMDELGRVPSDRRHDLVFENVQARMRTAILMSRGFVVGTGDLSELALGWCTYNADHMSMYNPNASIPKTLVRFLVEWAAENEFDGEARRTLTDILATEISPELLPLAADGSIAQSTEGTIGPYELHDFFLYHLLRHGHAPEKILYLACQATFDRPYTKGEIRRWLELFVRRFFTNQYKRSCLPDGPKVGTVSLSPRGDWRMPSDAVAALWLRWLDEPAVRP
jgi:NAD+ synthase (glutamine-hydrolysing)